MVTNQANTNLTSLNNSKLSLYPEVPPVPRMTRQEQKCNIVRQRVKLEKIDEAPNKLKDSKCAAVNYGGVEHKAYKIRKCNVIKNSPSVFKLPTEESYNKMNELFDSIKILVQKQEGKSTPKERMNTATTNATEKLTQEFHLSYSPEKLQEMSFEEDFLELEELKKGIEGGESIGLVPSLRRDSFSVRMAVADIMLHKSTNFV
jgi:hypothetical protein